MSISGRSWLFLLPFGLSSLAGAVAQDPAPASRGGQALPAREVTVFKDGHSYVLREMALTGDGRQQIVIDELPEPVLGTFWPYAGGGARLVSARAGRRKLTETVPAVDLRQLARANVGKDVVAVDAMNNRIEGRLVAVPTRDEAGQEQSGIATGELMLISTSLGTRAVSFSQLRDLEIKGELQSTVTTERLREELTLDVVGGGQGATVGVMYVQRGLRWIPSYRLDIDGKGQAAVHLQATLVNDLIDLDRATVHLVVGVPKFEFEGLVDPISLQQEVAQVAARARRETSFSNLLSNSLMTQSAGYVAAGEVQDPAPAVEGSEANEDLFVFTLRDVTLKVGERMVLPIDSYSLAYRDIYTLEIPFAPPMEVRQGLQSSQVLELARELAAPKAVHVLRLTNAGKAPLTTAPALVLNQGRVLAQGRMRYTPIGQETDLAINTAIDIHVETEEHESGRTPNAQRFGGDQYGRIDLVSSIALRNSKPIAVDLEVTRRVLGLVDSVGQEGAMQQMDLVRLWQEDARPVWWSWWSWPYWWFRFNGFGEYRWTVRLAPGASAELEAGWHYFWR